MGVRGDMVMWRSAIRNRYGLTDNHRRLMTGKLTELLMLPVTEHERTVAMAVKTGVMLDRFIEECDRNSPPDPKTEPESPDDPRCRELMDELAYRMAELARNNSRNADGRRAGAVDSVDTPAQIVGDVGGDDPPR